MSILYSREVNKRIKVVAIVITAIEWKKEMSILRLILGLKCSYCYYRYRMGE